MEYNAEEGLAEITVRTFADDLEAILSKRTGKSVRVDGSEAADTLMLGYMQSVFQLKSGVQEVELQWIGIELKANTAWIYLQAKLPRGRWKTSLRNTFLFDLFEDQVNIVNVLAKAKKASLVFKRGDAAQEIPGIIFHRSELFSIDHLTFLIRHFSGSHFVVLRVTSCYCVDRLLGREMRTIHEITRTDTNKKSTMPNDE